MARNYLIQVRRDTASNWNTTNPVLAAGELGFETNSGKVKVGDGVKTWQELIYLADNMSDNVITDRVLRDSAGLSVIGRSTNTTGDPEDIVASQDHQVLRRSGNALNFGQVVTAGIANQAITSNKIATETIVDEDISMTAGISPSKLGPGTLPTDVLISTPSYINRSVTHSKLSNTVDETGVGVWLTYTPVLTTREDISLVGQYNVLYSKYMKLNNIMMVNVLVQFTNVTEITDVVFCSLPQQPVAPNLTNLGSAYHINSGARPMMPPIVPINVDGKVGFIDHRGQYYFDFEYWFDDDDDDHNHPERYGNPFWWWWKFLDLPEQAEHKKGWYLGRYRGPDRLSFDLVYEVA